MPTFEERFGVDNGCDDHRRRPAPRAGRRCSAGTNLNVEGMTSFHDTNYAGQGEATAAALDKYDLVFSHVEAPDEASHQADWKTKVDAIEHIDKHVVGPVLEKLQHVPRVADPRHARPPHQHRHAQARLRPDAPSRMAGTRVKQRAARRRTPRATPPRAT